MSGGKHGERGGEIGGERWRSQEGRNERAMERERVGGGERDAGDSWHYTQMLRVSTDVAAVAAAEHVAVGEEEYGAFPQRELVLRRRVPSGEHVLSGTHAVATQSQESWRRVEEACKEEACREEACRKTLLSRTPVMHERQREGATLEREGVPSLSRTLSCSIYIGESIYLLSIYLCIYIHI